MKTLQLSFEQAKSLHATADKDMKELLEANFPELGSKVVDSWEDLGEVSGYYSANNSNVLDASFPTISNNKNIHPTKEDVESCIALAQLQQLILRTGDGVSYKEWGNENIPKYLIVRHKQKAIKDFTYNEFFELAFKTKYIRDEFLNKHLPLINTYLKIK